MNYYIKKIRFDKTHSTILYLITLKSQTKYLNKFNKKPINLSQNEIIKIYGKPSFEKKNCFVLSKLSTITKELKCIYWIYGSISKFGFDTYDKIGNLSYLSFDSKDIKTEKLVFRN